MARGRRCDLGCESWPPLELYAKCLHCGEPTKVYGNLQPLDEDEAKSILLHKEFETYYERYCALNDQPVEGPLSEYPSDSVRLPAPC